MDLKQNLTHFQEVMQETLSAYPSTLSLEYYRNAVTLIKKCRDSHGRVHVTGVGKPGHVASYAASLLSSTGTPSYFLHATEAVHGSCGQLEPGDVVICISNSGNTEELKSTVLAVQRIGCSVLGISGNPKSWLAEHSDVFLLASAAHEGGPLDRAPMASVLVECMTLQGLCVLLETDRELSLEDYVLRHPSGALGRLEKKECQPC